MARPYQTTTSVYMNVLDLPSNTTFWVQNGAWGGAILEEDNVKYIKYEGSNEILKLEKRPVFMLEITIKEDL